MKYRHYAPGAPVTLVDASDEKRIAFLSKFTADNSVAIICFDEDEKIKSAPNAYIIGSKGDPDGQAHALFAMLRSFDDKEEIKQIYAPLPDKKGIGLAIFNRMLKASGYTVIKV